MRLWSIHPEYLDAKGLVALWREGLLAQKVLQGKTKGYKHHPQLERFKKQQDPLEAINSYLHYIWEVANARGYKFNRKKIGVKKQAEKIKVTRGQICFEFDHLKRKLQKRDKQQYIRIKDTQKIKPHPLIGIVNLNAKELWERL